MDTPPFGFLCRPVSILVLSNDNLVRGSNVGVACFDRNMICSVDFTYSYCTFPPVWYDGLTSNCGIEVNVGGSL